MFLNGRFLINEKYKVAIGLNIPKDGYTYLKAFASAEASLSGKLFDLLT